MRSGRSASAFSRPSCPLRAVTTSYAPLPRIIFPTIRPALDASISRIFFLPRPMTTGACATLEPGPTGRVREGLEQSRGSRRSGSGRAARRGVRFPSARRRRACGYSPHFGPPGYSRAGVGEEELKATIAELERRLEASERSVRALGDSERLFPLPLRRNGHCRHPSIARRSTLHRLQRGGIAPLSGRERRAAPGIAGPRPVHR